MKSKLEQICVVENVFQFEKTRVCPQRKGRGPRAEGSDPRPSGARGWGLGAEGRDPRPSGARGSGLGAEGKDPRPSGARGSGLGAEGRDLHPPKTKTAFFIAAGLVVVIAGSCGGGKRANQQTRTAPTVPVTVGKVVQKTMPVTLRAIGHVEAISAVAIKARIGGELQKVNFIEGNNVTGGQVLFSIDSRPYQAALAQAQAVLAKDQALLTKAEADIKRYADLVKQDFVTREQYDQITTTAASLRAALAADQANVDNAKLNLDYCSIIAPTSGRTGHLLVKPGNLVKANDDRGLVTINQTKPIYANFSIPAQFLPEILTHRNDNIKVTAKLGGEGGSFDGKLTFIDNGVDAATSTIMLKATFANLEERLWPGQFVDVIITIKDEPNRIVAPSTAVQASQQGQYVYVVKDDDSVELRTVTVDRMDEVDAVITTGLTPGETVVTDGQLRLVPGAKVQIKESASGGGSAK